MIDVANSGVRFLLEVAGLLAIGYWGYQRTDGSLRWLLMLLPPLIVATLWAVFRVPGDGGDPVVAVPGALRLIFEFVVFALAVVALYSSGLRNYAVILLVVVVAHYVVDWERVRWLLVEKT